MKSTCMYCGTEVTVKNGMDHCEFCEMDLAATEIMQNGERKKVTVKPFVSIEHMYKSTRELMGMGTYELLVLLQLGRKERSSSYDMMMNAKEFHRQAKAENNETAIEIMNDTLEASVENYAYLTRKVWSVENILLERMDAIPVRITDSYLDKYFQKIQSRNLKPMVFASPKKQENAI